MSSTLSIETDCEELGGVDGDGLGEGEVAFEGEQLLWEEDDVPPRSRQFIVRRDKCGHDAAHSIVSLYRLCARCRFNYGKTARAYFEQKSVSWRTLG